MLNQVSCVMETLKVKSHQIDIKPPLWDILCSDSNGQCLCISGLRAQNKSFRL